MYCYTIENRIRRNRFKMYGFFKNGKVNKELDEIIAQIESNAANNYKDAV